MITISKIQERRLVPKFVVNILSISELLFDNPVGSAIVDTKPEDKKLLN